MTLEVAGISLKVDSTDAVTAKANLDAMAKAGAGSAAALGQVEAGARTAGAALSQSAAAAASSARGIAATSAGARTAADGLRATGQQAKLTGNQAAQLSAQLQDLFVQIQAGGSPLTALIQQGSQLSAVFGGVAPALRAVGGVLFSTAAAYTALAAAGVGLGAAFLIGREQSADLTRQLILSGNAAGVTEGQFNALAQSIADSTSTTIGSTRDTLQDLAASGRISGEVLGTAATAVQLLSKVTGQASTEIAKEFAKAADSPSRFAEETNRAYNFLTASQLTYIRSLEDQGRGQEALALTFSQLIPRLQQAAGATTGLGRAFQEAKNEVSAFFDALVSGLGRTDTAEDQLRRVQASIAELQRAGQKGYIFGPSMSDLQQQEAGLQRTIAGQREVAAVQAQRAQREQAAIRFDKLREQSLTKQQRLAKELADANALADKAGVSQEGRQGVLASIRDRFKTAGGGGGDARAALAADLAGIRAAEAEKVAIYRNTEGVIDALRQAGVLRDADYYDAKRAYVRLDQQAQEEAINAEIARLQAFRGTAAENLGAQREIVQARAALAQVQAAGAARAVILDIQQRAAVDALAKSFRELEFAAVEAYQATARRIDFATGSQGLGDRARDQAADEFAVRERYTRQLQQLEAQNRAGAFAADQVQFEKRRQLLLDNQEFELAQTAEAYQRLDALRARWEIGFSVGIANVLDGAGDTARRTQQLTEDTFRGLGDALTDVFTTGKADWRSLEKTILSGITRIIIEQQAIKPIAAFLQGGASSGGGGLLSSLFSSAVGLFAGGGTGDYNTLAALSGRRAAGGPVRRGGLYEVNELAAHGPGEILTSGGRQYLMAREDGYVRPAAGGGGGVQQIIHFHNNGPVDRRTQQQIATAAGRGAQQAMARNG